MSAALRLLTRREYSRKELTERLLQKYNQQEVEETIDWCEKNMLLSENRFVESRIRHRISQGYGPRWIQQDLRQHGIQADLIEEYLPSDINFWVEQACFLLSKKFKSVTDYSQKLKIQGYLYQRGYFSEHIRSALMKFEHL